MKTRTLMLLALGCGVAIMLAGAVFLFQVANQDDLAEPASIGSVVAVGDMSVIVTGPPERGEGTLTVQIEIGGTEDEAPAEDFRMIASGRPAPLVGTTCPPTGPQPQTCVITFDVATADGASRVLFYERGDEQARWVLAG